MCGVPALFDLDADGDVELIALSDDGFLNAWNSEAVYSEANFPWPQHRQNTAHTASYLQTTQHIAKSGDLFVDKSVFCYPNPTRDNVVYIRYQLSEQVDDLTVDIFDLIGERVTELKGTQFINSDNEVAWNLDGISSGVYLARLEAKSGSRNRVEFIKIAVVK